MAFGTRYRIKLVGKSPMLMHQDNIKFSEETRRWRQTPENRKFSVAGDDRSPAHTWIGSLYHDGQHVVVPADNLMRCLMEGGASVPVPGGRGSKTFKSQTQSGMGIMEDWPILVDGRKVPCGPLLALKDERDFEIHAATVLEHMPQGGVELHMKRARIGAAKHVRVRPKFNRWSTEGVINVWDEQITLGVLRDIFNASGAYKGLGDWRPGGKTPGYFGRFEATVDEI